MVDRINYAALGERVRALRIKRGMTMDELAALTSLSRIHINHIETNRTKLSLAAVVNLANALEVSADELICDSLKCSKPIYENELSEQLQGANAKQTKLVSELAKVALRDDFKRMDN